MYLILLVFASVIDVSLSANADDIYAKQIGNQWFKDGVNAVKEKLRIQNINKKAKGVILFLGDGMGPSTVTAARILDGQLKGGLGEENVLSWEKFDNTGFSKTYNTDSQVGDSAGTATAFMTGVKSSAGVISVDESVNRGDCASSKGKSVLSILMMAELAGLSTGVVSTARVTHATPATAYAHSADRGWEDDADIKVSGGCKDIARQLIEFPYGDGLEVAFGGGRRSFLPVNVTDPEDPSKYGLRKDGRNLITEWLQKHSRTKISKHVWNETGFKNLDPAKSEHILGLFSYSHMAYAYDRINDTAGEPSLTEMVEFAIKALKKNPKGYFLLVEAGRIDHGHHAAKAFHALHDAVEMGRAVEKAASMTNPSEELLVVTADHSHVFTLGGYQSRGTPIFNYTNQKRYKAKDSKRYTTLGYVNGPGATINKSREEPTLSNLNDPNFQYQSLIPLDSETHAGEDVGIYARGPQSHLIRGVVEQNYIFHVMDYALCLSESKKEICRQEGIIPKASSSSPMRGLLPFPLSVSISLVFLYVLM